jgi:predicted DNA-binding transcriptional regulator AlpA
MTTKRKPTSSPAELSETEFVRAQLKELQSIVGHLCVKMDVTPPTLIADGITLLNTKQAMHITGLSRSGLQKMIKSGKVGAKWSEGRWFINPATLPRPR